MEVNRTFSPTPLTTAMDAYLEETIKYLSTPSPEARLAVVKKMKEYAVESGIFFHLEKLQKQFVGLENGYESAWELFAKEAEKGWFFDKHPELEELFFKVAKERGLAKKKWVICSD